LDSAIDLGTESAIASLYLAISSSSSSYSSSFLVFALFLILIA